MPNEAPTPPPYLDRELLDAIGSKGAHDMKAHLRAINSFCELLREDLVDDMTEDREQYLHFIQRGGGQLACLIERLMTFIRLDDVILQWEEVEPTIWLNHHLSSPLPDPWRVDADGPPLPIEPRLLGLALDELVENARRYAGEGVAVEISLHREGTDGVLEVRDYGPGLTGRQLTDACDVFRRFVPDEHSKGAGFGLPICRKVAWLMNGSLELESMMPGLRVRLTWHR